MGLIISKREWRSVTVEVATVFSRKEQKQGVSDNSNLLHAETPPIY